MNRLKELRNKAGLTQRGLAAATGTTFQNIYKLEKGLRSLDQHWLDKLAPALNVSAGDILGHDAVVNPSVRLIPVIGYVEAGVWHEAHEIDEDFREQVPISSDIPYADHLFVVKVRGTSMNKLYAEGTPLYCVRIEDTSHDLINGQKVIVMRRSPAGDTVEMTVKVYEKTAKSIKLWPRSTDPRHQEPIIIPLDDDNQDGAQIYAIVKYALTIES